jgi:hypothetical protein
MIDYQWRRLDEELKAQLSAGTPEEEGKQRIIRYIQRPRWGYPIRLPEQPPYVGTAWMATPRVDFATSTITLPIRVRGRLTREVQAIIEVPAGVPEKPSRRAREPASAPGVITTENQKAEADFEVWLEEIGKGDKRKKDDVKSAAQTMFPKLTGEGFLRVWRKSAPASWRKAGPPKRSA